MGWGAPPLFYSLIRIPSSVFPTELGLDMSGFINRSRKYYWPGPSAPSLLAAVSVSALLPPHSSGVLAGHWTGHCGTEWKLQQYLHWLYTWPGLSFHCSCNALHTHTHTHTHTPAAVGGKMQSALLHYDVIAALCWCALLRFQLLECYGEKDLRKKGGGSFKAASISRQTILPTASKRWGA